MTGTSTPSMSAGHHDPGVVQRVAEDEQHREAGRAPKPAAGCAARSSRSGREPAKVRYARNASAIGTRIRQIDDETLARFMSSLRCTTDVNAPRPLALHLLDQPAEVGPVAGRALHVEGGGHRDRDDGRGAERDDRPQPYPELPAEQEHRRDAVARDHREHAADVGTPERRAVRDERDPRARHAGPSRMASAEARREPVGEEAGEQQRGRGEQRVPRVAVADEATCDLGARTRARC